MVRGAMDVVVNCLDDGHVVVMNCLCQIGGLMLYCWWTWLSFNLSLHAGMELGEVNWIGSISTLNLHLSMYQSNHDNYSIVVLRFILDDCHDFLVEMIFVLEEYWCCWWTWLSFNVSLHAGMELGEVDWIGSISNLILHLSTISLIVSI